MKRPFIGDRRGQDWKRRKLPASQPVDNSNGPVILVWDVCVYLTARIE